MESAELSVTVWSPAARGPACAAMPSGAVVHLAMVAGRLAGVSTMAPLAGPAVTTGGPAPAVYASPWPVVRRSLQGRLFDGLSLEERLIAHQLQCLQAMAPAQAHARGPSQAGAALHLVLPAARVRREFAHLRDIGGQVVHTGPPSCIPLSPTLLCVRLHPASALGLLHARAAANRLIERLRGRAG